MRLVLHILTRPADPWQEQFLKGQRQLPDCQVEVVDLTHEKPDYQDLLDQIFDADSIQVW